MLYNHLPSLTDRASASEKKMYVCVSIIKIKIISDTNLSFSMLEKEMKDFLMKIKRSTQPCKDIRYLCAHTMSFTSNRSD